MQEKQKLFKNFFSLAILQGTNYILPLLTLPYLVRILGPDRYGYIAFAQVFIQYFVLITDYGFNLTGTRQISINRNNKMEVSKIVSSILTIKIILMLISFLVVFVITQTVNRFEEDFLIYLVTFGIVIGNTLFPIWFFQGIEKMKYITQLNIIAKLTSTLAIFVFIKDSNDFLLVPLFNSLGYILVGLISIYLIFFKFGIKYIFPSLKQIKDQLVDGWYVFISSLAISLYTVSNTFILGLFTNNTIVGYYASGEKIVKAIQGLIQPVTQTIYPHISNLVLKSRESALLFIGKIALVIGIITCIFSVSLLIFSEQIVYLILGHNYEDSIIVVQILSFLPFIIGLSNVFGVQTMLNFNLKKEYTTVIIFCSIFSIVLSLILVPHFGITGTSITVLLTELIVTILLYVFLKNRGINFKVKN